MQKIIYEIFTFCVINVTRFQTGGMGFKVIVGVVIDYFEIFCFKSDEERPLLQFLTSVNFCKHCWLLVPLVH